MYILSVLDASGQIPRGIFTGNLMDLGNYHQCLALHHALEDIGSIDGKFCLINIPLGPLTEMPWFKLELNTTKILPEIVRRLKFYQRLQIVQMSMTEEVDVRYLIFYAIHISSEMTIIH